MTGKNTSFPQLTANEVRYIADQIPAMVAYIDNSGHFWFVNAAYARWFGKNPEALVGTHAVELLGHELVEERRAYVDAVLAGRAVDFTATLPHWSGTLHSVKLSYTPDIIPGSEEVQGFTCLLIDQGPR